MTEEESKTVIDDHTKTVDDNKVDESAIQEDGQAPERESQKDETSSEGEEQVRRVMFETDNWEDCITESVWFGQKIPQKKRFVGRQATVQKDPVVAFFEEIITFEGCKTHLIEVEQAYMDASREHDREWEEEKVRQTWEKNVKETDSISALMPLITQLDDGMSLPTSLCSR